MPCCAVLSHAAWPCLHRPVLPRTLHTCKAVGASGLQPRAVPGDPSLDPSNAGGAGQGARPSGQCVPGGGSHGARPHEAAVGGREELGAAPLGALDVTAAGLSGRSRSCPDRSLAATPAANSPCWHSSARHRGPAAPLLPCPPQAALLPHWHAGPLTGGCPGVSASSSLHHCGRAGLVLGPPEPPRVGEMLPHLEASGVCGAMGGDSHGVPPHSTIAPQLLEPSH